MKIEEVKALFLLAGIEVQETRQLPNGYWPDHPDYAEIRRNEPWWMIVTPFGLIEIGWRKRVIEISWVGTAFRQIVTEKQVTKSEVMVHAWSFIEALEYLTTFRRAMTVFAETQAQQA
jgi:hypothetical protein